MSAQRNKGRQQKPQQLLVEGQDDQHVVWHLCEQYRLPEVFDVKTPGLEEELGGIDAVIKDIPVRLRQETLRTLGIMVDADANPMTQWERIRGALPTPMRTAMPPEPAVRGWIGEPTNIYGTPIRIGIWLMPEGYLRSGMLEDFALQLIRADDPLLAKALATLDEVEQIDEATRQRYSANHRSKALIHTWLAWQQNPGRPMGTAIKAGYLRYDAPPALAFVAWLRRLFALGPTTEAI